MAKEGNGKSRLLLWVTYGVIVTALVGTTTLSRYMTTVSGTGSATVAGFYVDSNVASLSIDLEGLSLGTPKDFVFEVTNANDDGISDVTQTYYIEVITTGNLPILYSLVTTDATITQDESSFKWTGGELPHSERTTHTYTLTATWDSSKTEYAYMDEVDAVQIVVHAEQKD